MDRIKSYKAALNKINDIRAIIQPAAVSQKTYNSNKKTTRYDAQPQAAPIGRESRLALKKTDVVPLLPVKVSLSLPPNSPE